MTAPKKEAIDAVTEWMLQHGIATSDIRISGSRVQVSTTLERASSLFAMTFVTLVDEQRRAVLRALDYTIPQHVQQHVATVFGLHGLPLPKAKTPPAGGEAYVGR
jgi:hypothetical protein